MLSFGIILFSILNLLKWILIIHIIMGWLINFQVLNMRQPIVAHIYAGLNSLLEPIYRQIRRFLPATGAMDFSPIVLFLGIFALQVIIQNNMMF